VFDGIELLAFRLDETKPHSNAVILVFAERYLHDIAGPRNNWKSPSIKSVEGDLL